MAEIKAKSTSVSTHRVFATFLIVTAFILLAQGFGAAFFSMFGLHQSEGHITYSGNPENMRLFILLSQLFGTLIGLLIFPLAYLFILRKDLLLEIVEFKSNQWYLFAVLGIILLLTAIPVVSALGLWNIELLKKLPDVSALEKLENLGKEVTALMLNIEGIPDLIFVVLVVAVLPGVTEELVFRGILQNTLQKYMNPHLSVFISAGVFSFIHFQFFGFFPRWYLGILLGYIYLFSGNILISMLAHFFNNFFIIISYYMYQKGNISTHPEALDNTAMPLPLILASAGFTILILIRMWKMKNSQLL